MRQDKDLVASHGCILGIIVAVVTVLFVVVGKLLHVLLPLLWRGLVALFKGGCSLIRWSFQAASKKGDVGAIHPRKP